jgi:hypothetical protein
MAQKGHQRKKYPSDLTDEQWASLEPMIPPAKQNTQGGPLGRWTCGKCSIRCST